jgi:hypothetical protein
MNPEIYRRECARCGRQRANLGLYFLSNIDEQRSIRSSDSFVLVPRIAFATVRSE